MHTRDLACVHALHAATRVALRAAPPIRAKRWIDALGSRLPQLSTLDEAREATAWLARAGGSCLSRSLTVSALWPDSVVVIGARASAGAPFRAHAWVEHGGVALDDDAPRRFVVLTRVARGEPTGSGSVGRWRWLIGRTR